MTIGGWALANPPRWPAALTVALGGFLALACGHAEGALLGWAVASGVLIAASPWVGGPPWLAAALLLAGAVPIALFLWWTLVVPLVAVLALLTGFVARPIRLAAADTGASAGGR